MKKSNKKSKDEIIETLYSEIKRKDEFISKLKEENTLLMKTALKASERLKKAEEKLVQK